MKQQRNVALPRYGEYNCVLKYIVEQGFEARCVLPPPLSRRTEDLGARSSPDLVCTPFKTTLGSMIEALEAAHVPVESTIYHGVMHGAGPATGTAAEGWIDRAVSFWKKQGE